MNPWIEAARPKTLPLAVSSILAGNFIAYAEGKFAWIVCILSVLTAILLQILSNFANDYGDYTKGTDSKNRLGPRRAVSSGDITPGQMIVVIIFTAAVTFLSGLLLLWFGNTKSILFKWILLALGLLSIGAAITYTVGKKPYGYKAMGDLAVLLFFGFLAVLGTILLQTGSINGFHLLIGVSMGAFAMAVLNINNVRDYTSDKEANKKTIPVLIGRPAAKIYHICLNLIGICNTIIYTLIEFKTLWQFLFLLAAVPLAQSTLAVYKNNNPAELNSELKRQSLSTFFFSLLFGIGLIISLS